MNVKKQRLEPPPSLEVQVDEPFTGSLIPDTMIQDGAMHTAYEETPNHYSLSRRSSANANTIGSDDLPWGELYNLFEDYDDVTLDEILG